MKKYLLFALAGYAIGNLFAPQKGSLLRKEIGERFVELQEKAEKLLLEAQPKLEMIAEKTLVAVYNAQRQASSLHGDGQKLAAPAVAQAKEQAKDLKHRVDEFFVARNLRRIRKQMDEMRTSSS